MKQCGGPCGLVKPLEDFASDRRMATGRQSWCRLCTSERNKSLAAEETQEDRDRRNERRRARYDSDARAQARQENLDRVRESERRHQLRRYGLTIEQYDQMVEDQDGCCAICGGEVDRLRVDHDHETGGVRGLLCHGCNTALGLMADDPERLLAAGGM